MSWGGAELCICRSRKAVGVAGGSRLQGEGQEAMGEGCVVWSGCGSFLEFVRCPQRVLSKGKACSKSTCSLLQGSRSSVWVLSGCYPAWSPAWACCHLWDDVQSPGGGPRAQVLTVSAQPCLPAAPGLHPPAFGHLLLPVCLALGWTLLCPVLYTCFHQHVLYRLCSHHPP